jgi:hypothetical protein
MTRNVPHQGIKTQEKLLTLALDSEVSALLISKPVIDTNMK